jgi:hypothetical protein
MPIFKGPFPLNAENIDAEFLAVSPGNYRVGFKDVGGDFVPYYVGRDDKNLNKRLKDHADKYHFFVAAYASTPEIAFKQECYDYHHLSPKDNVIHPACPANTDLKCPYPDLD